MATKIYTKTGDGGQTALFGGKRLPKHALRIEAYGTVDELNSNLGHLADRLGEIVQAPVLTGIQNQLFNLGSLLAADPEKEFKLPQITEDHCTILERAIDNMEGELKPLKQFILPSGHPDASFCHIVRTVSRRAERRVVALAAEEEVAPILVKYLNRLSDYLFVLARYILHLNGKEETPWNSEA